MKEINLKLVKRYSIKNRRHKVHLKDLVYFDPDYKLDRRKLTKDFKDFVHCIKNSNKVILGLGGHVIKVGMGPLLGELLKRGLVHCLAGNCSVAIHDFELAAFGMTSEYVEDNLPKGKFGLVEETNKLFHEAVRQGSRGLGCSLGKFIEEFPNKEISLLWQAYKHKIPFTIHTSIGAETIYQHPECDGARLGELSFRDFKILANEFMELGNGGVYANIGSAVIMPEVFLKALTVAKNINPRVKKFYTANFDMIDHYRPRENVIKRPTSDGGQGFQFIGRHEDQIPKLVYALVTSS